MASSPVAQYQCLCCLAVLTLGPLPPVPRTPPPPASRTHRQAGARTMCPLSPSLSAWHVNKTGKTALMWRAEWFARARSVQRISLHSAWKNGCDVAVLILQQIPSRTIRNNSVTAFVVWECNIVILVPGRCNTNVKRESCKTSNVIKYTVCHDNLLLIQPRQTIWLINITSSVQSITSPWKTPGTSTKSHIFSPILSYYITIFTSQRYIFKKSCLIVIITRIIIVVVVVIQTILRKLSTWGSHYLCVIPVYCVALSWTFIW